jgi:signal transduction histidine kinase
MAGMEACLGWECCWHKKEITPEECPNIAVGEEDLYTAHRRRVVEKCLECPSFRNDLAAMQEAGHPLADVLPLIHAEYLDRKAQLQDMTGFLNSKTREVRFLHELSLVFQTSMDIDEVLSVAMTAITAGKGFGMNRAFLLMADNERESLKGYLGVGPKNSEEAWRTWGEIDRNNMGLKEMAAHFHRTRLSLEKSKFQDILERLSVPLNDQDHIFNRALRERKPILIEDAFHNPLLDYRLTQALGVDSFLVIPLISRNRRIGVIVADNCITHKPITLQDMQYMETFAFPVAFALERASLYERLQEEVDKLTAANQRLTEQQELIVTMEKMALVGRITSSIAHSIRNPLLVIGGFARSLLKTIAENDPKKEYLHSIVSGAKQLENVLEEVLDYSDSIHPAMDNWDVNQLVANVLHELRESLEERRIPCSLELAQDLPAAYMDIRRISYCVKTIILTAMESNTGAGGIRVRTFWNEDAIVLEVVDTATSISSETLKKLTTSFAVTEELGTGFSLPLCKAILERLGYPFSMETIPTGGVCYTIKLPIKKEVGK